MAVKTYNYLIPGEFTYDVNKIAIEDGIVKLKEDLSNVIARYHLESINSEDSVEDTSGNGRHGIAINSPSIVIGKLNNCFSFNGINQYINCGDIANFERTDAFSLECWFKTVYTGTEAQRIMAKMEAVGDRKGYLLYISGTTGYMTLVIRNSTSNFIAISDNIDWRDGNRHHLIVTYDGSSTASGVIYYIDNVTVVLTILNNDILNGTIQHTLNLNIGAWNGAQPFNGEIDEVVIYDKELTQLEVTYKYNSGNGRENEKYYSDKPTIESTDLFEPATVISWDSFLETLGGGNQGSIGYNLYKIDKANKYYWNDSAWVTGGSSNNYNSQAVINENIGSFDGSPDKIGFIAYLISNGDQAIELDENQIIYTTNQSPLVNAGSNKSCKDNNTISPFSDCSFSDPDGTVDHVYYKVDGEIDTWIEIPQGGYGTLLEAVQAWNYQFVNIGIKTVRLQVEDNEGTTSEDSLTVTVSQYIITFNVKDELGIHVSNFYFIAKDGAIPQLKSSPFTYGYDYNVTPYNTVFYKDNYITNFVEVISTDHTENVALIKTVSLRAIYPLSINLKRQVSMGMIKSIIKGDSITFECTLDEILDITNWKIRCEIYDTNEVSIKKATFNSGGSDLQIKITDSTIGKFDIYIDKGDTANITDIEKIEIELETDTGEIYTGYQNTIIFKNEKIKWSTP